MKTALLFLMTAAFEIAGCYLPFRVLRHGGALWLLGPGALALGLFAYLLTLHPSGAGRTYAAYGGVYIASALLWAWAVEGQVPTRADAVGAALSLCGAAVIVAGAPPAAQFSRRGSWRGRRPPR